MNRFLAWLKEWRTNWKAIHGLTEDEQYKDYRLAKPDLATMLELVMEFEGYHHRQLYDQYAGCSCTPCHEFHLAIKGETESFSRDQLERWLIRYYFSNVSSEAITRRMEGLGLIPYMMVDENPEPRRLQVVTTEPALQ